MEKLYNKNLDTGECIAERAVDWENIPVFEFVNGPLEASLGLENPTVDIESEDDYDFRNYTVSVSGKRQMTPEEIEAERERRAKEARFAEHMRRFPG